MAQATIWIRDGKRKIARPRVGTRIVEPEKTRVSEQGDMMETDEDGDVYLIPADTDECDEACEKYDAGIAEITPDEGPSATVKKRPRRKSSKKKSGKKKTAKRKPAKRKAKKKA